MESKRKATIGTLAAATIAVLVPIIVSIYLSYSQAIKQEQLHVLYFARDVLRRSGETSAQIDAGVLKLVEAHSADPCSRGNLTLMHQIAVSSSYLKGIGHLEDNHFVCSSLGDALDGVSIGAPDVVLPTGVRIWNNLQLPIGKGVKLVGVEKNGYLTILNANLVIDIATDVEGLSLGTFAIPSLRYLRSRGQPDPRWPAVLNAAPRERTFFDNGQVVAVVNSTRYFQGALAALPASNVFDRTRSVAMVLVPMGIVAGALLAWAVIYLAKIQLSLASVIRSGLKHEEFFLNYQPIVELSTGRWTGAEVLIRWRRQTGKLVSPDTFIPVAEKNGLIQRITERVIELASKDMVDIFKHHPDLHVAINLSSADLHSEATIGLVHRLYTESGAKPGNLVVEATERGFIEHEVARQAIRSFRSNGIRVAIDDFGTGYSSLSYLENLELDYLKIDKSFVDSIGTEAVTNHVVFHIIEMAKSLKIEMIAEGVETEAQAEILRDHGVQYAQGWLYAKPMPFAEFASQLLARAAKSKFPMPAE